MKPQFTISQSQVQLSSALPIRATHKTVNRPVEMHSHDYCELCLVLSGQGEHVTKDYRRRMNRGDLIIVAPGEVHAIYPSSKLRVINLYYLSEWLLRDVDEFWDKGPAFALFFSHALFRIPIGLPILHYHLPTKITTACQRELVDIEKECASSNPSSIYLRGAFAKLIILASGAYRGEPNSIYHAFRKEVWTAIERIEQLVRNGLPFQKEDASKGLSISKTHLSRLFKDQTGWTLSDYYQLRRLQRSCHILLDGQHSITETALECGFSDTSHFDRQFRRFFGKSPKQYRHIYGA